MKRTKFAVAIAASALTLLTAGACSSDGGENSGLPTVKVGTTDESDESWGLFVDAAARAGITVETVNFSDYTQANPALSQGQIDVNIFQHLKYLADYNVNNNDTLAPVGATQIVPLGLYSQKHTEVSQIPQGGQVAVPNDATNQSRGLFVLQSAGLITLTGGGSNPSLADIDKASSKVTVTEIDAAQTGVALPSVDAAIINNTFLGDLGIDPKSALVKDDPTDPGAEPYINAFVSRAENKDDSQLLTLVEAYHDKDVQAAIAKESEGTSVEVTRDGAELEPILAGLEAELRAK